MNRNRRVEIALARARFQRDCESLQHLVRRATDDMDADDALARSLVSTLLVLGLCWIALSVRQLGNRYVQTASALVACSIVFSLLVLPLAMLAGPMPNDGLLTPLQTLLVWVMFAIFVWSVLVDAHIIRRALDAPFGLGVALAIAWTIADWALGHALFDAAP